MISGLHIATDLDEQVSISNLTPQMLLGVLIVRDRYRAMGYECNITAGRDGKHKKNSLHYSGNAIDFRIRDVPQQIRTDLSSRIRRSLGQDFQVVLHNTHLHVEYQPQI
jgi:hypothetical protein